MYKSRDSFLRSSGIMQKYCFLAESIQISVALHLPCSDMLRNISENKTQNQSPGALHVLFKTEATLSYLVLVCLPNITAR